MLDAATTASVIGVINDAVERGMGVLAVSHDHELLHAWTSTVHDLAAVTTSTGLTARAQAGPSAVRRAVWSWPIRRRHGSRLGWPGERSRDRSRQAGPSGLLLDDIAVVPSRRTRDPEEVSLDWQIDAYHFEMPVMAAPMDSVMSPTTAIAFGKMGGLPVLDLEGLWTRYSDPVPLLEEIATSTRRTPPRGCSRSTPRRSSPN